MRRTQAAVIVACVIGVVSCTSEKDPPNDCGTPDMAIVTLQADTADRSPLRYCVDIHAAARLDADGASAGRDESFAVSRPGVYPWTNLTFQEASEACGRAGKFVCDWEVIKLITPTLGELTPGRVSWDSTTIEALPRNGPETSVAHRFDALNPVDMVIRGETGKPPFPESRASVAFYTIAPESADDGYNLTNGFVSGTISGSKVAGGVAQQAAVPKTGFKHPLIGFRCCALAQLRDAFPPLGQDPSRVRPEIDPEVPLAP